ncbi:DUF2303 family protein [Antarcticimicrobium sp.]|uniref:DUF2303 family protein n=1 Tax=Antarcticimicrobium sp. TaxID=2824147 RepID=UPI002611DC96|nr:DUF2303 family protein [Antarcticimicrobium sp.]
MEADHPTPENVAQTMREAMEQFGATEKIHHPEPDEIHYQPVLVSVPHGRDIKDLTKHFHDALEWLRPARRKGTARLRTLDSLIGWANRFQGETSVLYADPRRDAPSLTCIANYHGAGPTNLGPEGDSAAHCDHRGTYDFPLSKEWQAWMKISGQPLSKDDLSEFIDDHVKDLMDPTPALLSPGKVETTEDWETRNLEIAQKIMGRFGQVHQLIHLSREFQVHESSDLHISTDRDTGESTVRFEEKHSDAAGKPLRLPNLFLIAIPVFEAGDVFRLTLQFRYRKRGGSVQFVLSLYDPETALDTAFEEAVNKAAEETDLPLLIGTPET